MYLRTRTAIRSALRRVQRLPGTAWRRGNRSLALGALLLMTASTASVIATSNSAPVFTSLNLSQTTIYEGETVTLTGAFTDPDPGDGHTVLVYWYGGNSNDKEKLQIPPGQSTFQASHAYGDFVPIPSIKVVIYDHQLPPGTNDNSTGGFMQDTRFIPFQFTDAKPQFVANSIKVTKDTVSSVRSDVQIYVTIDGELAQPIVQDPVFVSASWNGVASTQTPCTVDSDGRHFQCEHTYDAASGVKGYPVVLRVRDDEGNLAMHAVTVKIP